MDEQEKKSFEQLHITAAEHPKALAPHVLILNIIMSVLGASALGCSAAVICS